MNPFTTNNARLLSDGQVVKTHEASLEILREVYARHGCDVDNVWCRTDSVSHKTSKTGND